MKVSLLKNYWSILVVLIVVTIDKYLYTRQLRRGVSRLMGPKKEGFYSKINCSKLKLLYFFNWHSARDSKSAKSVLSKSIFYVKNQPNIFTFINFCFGFNHEILINVMHLYPWIWCGGGTKVIYTKYSKHWLYKVAHTIECVCSKINNSWFNPWFSFYFSSLYPAPYIEWYICWPI